jgi:hypothetical protein
VNVTGGHQYHLVEGFRQFTSARLVLLQQTALSFLMKQQTPEPSGVDCQVCGNPIPKARLKAIPTTTICVSCLDTAGDVIKIRRLDEYTEHGGVTSTYFKRPNPYIQEHLERINSPGILSSVLAQHHRING